jgi:hypothetical protein
LAKASTNANPRDVVAQERFNQRVGKMVNEVQWRRVEAPAAAGDTGAVGDYAVADGYLYVCISANTWQRATLATW